jgi:uncharacterized protein (TIGR03083 family)
MEIPIETIHLFPKLDEKLLAVLRSLQPGDWAKPTLAKRWTVKDVATHLLDGNIRMLSMARDNFFGETPDKIESYQDLVAFLNRLNAEWVKATKRISPSVLIELLEITGKEYSACIAQLDPFKQAMFSVAWAGEEKSLNWFHIAREYTEKWHHQQQIREAVNQSAPLMTREFYYPLIDTFMQALPHTYRDVVPESGQAIQISVESEIGGDWFMIYEKDNWNLSKDKPTQIHANVALGPETAWKLFTKALSGSEAQKHIRFTGDETLGKPILSMLSVMA